MGKGAQEERKGTALTKRRERAGGRLRRGRAASHPVPVPVHPASDSALSDTGAEHPSLQAHLGHCPGHSL